MRREQIGFVKGCRTPDHMFILQSIIQKYAKNESKPLGTDRLTCREGGRGGVMVFYFVQNFFFGQHES